MRGVGAGTGAPGAEGLTGGSGARTEGRVSTGKGLAGADAGAAGGAGRGTTGSATGVARAAIGGAGGVDRAWSGGRGGWEIGGRTGLPPCSGGRKTGAEPPPAGMRGTIADPGPAAGWTGDGAGLGRTRSRVGSSNSGKRSGSSDALPRRRFRILSAVPSSRELEWVFLSLTPRSERRSSISWAFTSSSLANSLTRIFGAPVKPP